MDFSFSMDPKLLQEVNAASSPIWAAHPTATTTRAGGQAWREIVEIVDSAIGVDEKNPERAVVTVRFQCAADSPTEDGSPNPNVGRTHMEWFRFAPAALHDSGHKDRKMTVFSLSSLRNLARAAGLLSEDAPGMDFASLFISPGGDAVAPIVGARVSARARTYTDDKGVLRFELGFFTAEGA